VGGHHGRRGGWLVAEVAGREKERQQRSEDGARPPQSKVPRRMSAATVK
jgi:hypothetical protein